MVVSSMRRCVCVVFDSVMGYLSLICMTSRDECHDNGASGSERKNPSRVLPLASSFPVLFAAIRDENRKKKKKCIDLRGGFSVDVSPMMMTGNRRQTKELDCLRGLFR